jgi:pyrroline-5-carboxylate reductase
MRITFIGGGNMASALIGGLIKRGQPAADIRVFDPSAQQRDALTRNFGVHVHPALDATALDCDLVVMAVKPQQMFEAATSLAVWLRGQLVISVAAGIRASDLSRWLGGHQRIVRAMPNTPALVGEGVTGLAAPASLSAQDRADAQTVMDAVGRSVWVEPEARIDAVTAVSGSGPAYVFFFMEAMHKAALSLGLDDAQARTLTLATFSGAARLAGASDEPLSVLRERVTSKGGTTAAALAVLFERDVQGAIADAMAAACNRSAELGDEFGKPG